MVEVAIDDHRRDGGGDEKGEADGEASAVHVDPWGNVMYLVVSARSASAVLTDGCLMHRAETLTFG
jgi:hypothetical protein